MEQGLLYLRRRSNGSCVLGKVTLQGTWRLITHLPRDKTPHDPYENSGHLCKEKQVKVSRRTQLNLTQFNVNINKRSSSN